FFAYIKNLEINTRNILIYGATEEGIATKRTLELDHKIHYNVIAFLDDSTNKAKKSIDRTLIRHSSELSAVLQNEEIDELIIATPGLSVEKKNEIVDICLEYDVQILLTPPVREWTNGQLSARQIHNIKIEELLEREPIEINNEVIATQLKHKRVMVTGAAGSIGNEIVRQLAKFAPETIILVDIGETALYETEFGLKEQYPRMDFRYFIADVRNYERLESIFKEYKPHYVYHAAAYKHVPMMETHPFEAVSTNVLGTKNVADLAVKYGVEKFVMISTDKAVNPTNVMGATKRIAEVYVQSLYNHLHSAEKGEEKKSVKFITTRFGNVLGSNGSVIPRFASQIRNGGPVTVTHPDITRYFMTIPEACQLVLEAGSMGSGGEIFVFDMGKMVKITDLANKMIRLSGLIPGIDINVKFSGLRPGEKLYEELLNNEENTMTTYHTQILIAKVRGYDYEKVVANMQELAGLIRSAATQTDIVRMMKKMIPEFISNNSIFESLDRETAADAQNK
ncbi:MAG TPA: nucleoside-diphosphate sugar epimerase/dehydratase, partial [Puia sp.]|nr:nucleoside-diphosphate sugar epimerase/dehydratase [Puia sp.]